MSAVVSRDLRRVTWYGPRKRCRRVSHRTRRHRRSPEVLRPPYCVTVTVRHGGSVFVGVGAAGTGP
jgi:hypothetical protein